MLVHQGFVAEEVSISSDVVSLYRLALVGQSQSLLIWEKRIDARTCGVREVSGAGVARNAGVCGLGVRGMAVLGMRGFAGRKKSLCWMEITAM
ncbi:MAG: hypothetical protein RR547_09510 [Raoultibacter sp.]